LNQSRSVVNAKPIAFRHSNENRSIIIIIAIAIGFAIAIAIIVIAIAIVLPLLLLERLPMECRKTKTQLITYYLDYSISLKP